MSELKDINSRRSEEASVQRELGYLSRAVEDLSHELKTHMEHEDRDRTRLINEFSQFQHTTDKRFYSVYDQINSIREDLKGLRKYILILTVTLVGSGLLLDKVDNELLGVVASFFKLL